MIIPQQDQLSIFASIDPSISPLRLQVRNMIATSQPKDLELQKENPPSNQGQIRFTSPTQILVQITSASAIYLYIQEQLSSNTT